MAQVIECLLSKCEAPSFNPLFSITVCCQITWERHLIEKWGILKNFLDLVTSKVEVVKPRETDELRETEKKSIPKRAL
jgi:hypothetical protein